MSRGIGTTARTGNRPHLSWNHSGPALVADDPPDLRVFQGGGEGGDVELDPKSLPQIKDERTYEILKQLLEKMEPMIDSLGDSEEDAMLREFVAVLRERLQGWERGRR
jgi:hypothetical protein